MLMVHCLDVAAVTDCSFKQYYLIIRRHVKAVATCFSDGALLEKFKRTLKG